MRAHRLRLPVALALFAAGCVDETGPSPTAVQPPLAAVASYTGVHILRQAPTAPRLQAYRVSFWARRGTQTTVGVNYRRAPGQAWGDPFLRFKIPINGLVAGADGVPLQRGDSVRITLMIDSLSFTVDFQPSGVAFSATSPATLALWYQDANPDLNGDGVVDGTDAMLEQQLAIWGLGTKTDPWKQLASKNDTTQQYVASSIYHFSQYAVSW